MFQLERIHEHDQGVHTHASCKVAGKPWLQREGQRRVWRRVPLQDACGPPPLAGLPPAAARRRRPGWVRPPRAGCARAPTPPPAPGANTAHGPGPQPVAPSLTATQATPPASSQPAIRQAQRPGIEALARTAAPLPSAQPAGPGSMRSTRQADSESRCCCCCRRRRYCCCCCC
jgi:hypothetical protein